MDIKKSGWIRSFEGRSLDNPTLEGWAVKKDKGEFEPRMEERKIIRECKLNGERNE